MIYSIFVHLYVTFQRRSVIGDSVVLFAEEAGKAKHSLPLATSCMPQAQKLVSSPVHGYRRSFS